VQESLLVHSKPSGTDTNHSVVLDSLPNVYVVQPLEGDNNSKKVHRTELLDSRVLVADIHPRRAAERNRAEPAFAESDTEEEEDGWVQVHRRHETENRQGDVPEYGEMQEDPVEDMHGSVPEGTESASEADDGSITSQGPELDSNDEAEENSGQSDMEGSASPKAGEQLSSEESDEQDNNLASTPPRRSLRSTA
jgi:hypothetical protein